MDATVAGRLDNRNRVPYRARTKRNRTSIPPRSPGAIPAAALRHATLQVARARAARDGAVRRRPRRVDRQRRAAVDRHATSTSRRTTCPGSSTPTRWSSAASCCSAAGSPTCSAAGGCSSPAWSCSPLASLAGGLAADRHRSSSSRAPCRASAPRSSPPPRCRSSRRRSPRAPSATRRSASGARSPAPAAPPACCSAACSPSALGWEWVLFVNVPIGLAAAFARAAAARREPRRRPQARTSTSPGAVTVTAGLALLVYALVDANDAGWGSTQTLVPRGRGARAARRVRRDRAAPGAPARAVLDLPAADAARRERHRAADRHVAVLDVLLRLALHAAGAGLRRAEGRARVPAAGADDHLLGRRRVAAGDADRVQADAHRRAAVRRRGPAVVLAGVGRTAPTSATCCSRRCWPRSASGSRSSRSRSARSRARSPRRPASRRG